MNNMNIATDENYSVDKIAKIALKVCDAEHLQIKYNSDRPNGQMRKDIDTAILMKNFPNFKLIRLSDGIKEIYQKLKMTKTLLFGGSGFFGPVILSKDKDIISVGRSKPRTVKINTYN